MSFSSTSFSYISAVKSIAHKACFITTSARMSWVTSSRAGSFFFFLQEQYLALLLHLVLHTHDKDLWVSNKEVLLLWNGANDSAVDAVPGIQFLVLQLSPLWQCEVHSICFFLQGHLWVLQPALHLHLFFENALHNVLSFEASRSNTQVELCHPFSDRLQKIQNHKQNRICSTLLTCTAKVTWHKSFQLPAQLFKAVYIGSVEALTVTKSPTWNTLTLCWRLYFTIIPLAFF